MTTEHPIVPEEQQLPGRRYTPAGIEVPAPSERDVLYEVRDGVAWITLNRPMILNAADWSLILHLGRALDRAEADADVRVVVLGGAGRAFCAGADLQSAQFYPKPDDLPDQSMPDNGMRIWRMSKPVIASVRGHAVGMGFQIAGMCDLTIAAEEAVVGELQIRNGLLPPMLITPFLTGLKEAKWVLLTGATMTAAEAQRIGIVNQVVPAADLDATVEALAVKMAALPAVPMVGMKKIINRVYEIAGMMEGFDYFGDPALTDLTASMQRASEEARAQRAALIEEQGWDAFRAQRDANFR